MEEMNILYLFNDAALVLEELNGSGNICGGNGGMMFWERTFRHWSSGRNLENRGGREKPGK